MSHKSEPIVFGRVLWVGVEEADAAGFAEPLLCGLATAASLEAGLLRFRNGAFDAIAVTGFGGEDCEAFADAVRSEGSGVPLVFRLAGGDVRLSARLAHAGATAVYGPDTSLEDILHETDRLASEYHRRLRRQVGEREPWRQTIIGRSEGMRRVCEVIARVAERKSTVLITGESGTGKEVVARAIHMASGRSRRPMLSVNCAAIPEGLLESELFGHVRGAFTGAVQQRAGLFEQASGGTLFLDEIGDMPMGLQAKLLRVLQEQQFQRLGSAETIRVDVRIIAATNTKLEKLIREGRFREDLFYRLNVVGIAMPALRDRAEDIPLLAAHFAAKICQAEGLPVKEIMPAAMTRLYRQSWPGNVRQLQNVIERAVVLGGEERVVRPGDIDVPKPCGPVGVPEAGIIDITHGLDYERTVRAFERNILEQALKQTSGNKTRAAELLRLGRTTLAAKLRVLGEVA
jgi:DNA-binding NtrC family response regulator